jgi:hypothetical protein
MKKSSEKKRREQLKRENTKELFKTVRMMRTREETRGVVVEHREE